MDELLTALGEPPLSESARRLPAPSESLPFEQEERVGSSLTMRASVFAALHAVAIVALVVGIALFVASRRAQVSPSAGQETPAASAPSTAPIAALPPGQDTVPTGQSAPPAPASTGPPAVSVGSLPVAPPRTEPVSAPAKAVAPHASTPKPGPALKPGGPVDFGY